MTMNRIPVLPVTLAAVLAGGPTTPEPSLETAKGHAIQYYLSLPDGWNRKGTWPVVVVIDAANREFHDNLMAFAKARGAMPFILVAPLVVTNGGARYRVAPGYRYTDAAWSEIERMGLFRFDETGIATAVEDVRVRFSGDAHYFLTGWEAAGHTVWAMAFRHPEALRAVAPVNTNYQGRWMTEADFSSSPARADLPVRILLPGGTPDAPTFPALIDQSNDALRIAREHGFKNVSLTKVPGKPHGPLASDVLALFESLVAR